jgi:urease accessory protein
LSAHFDRGGTLTTSSDTTLEIAARAPVNAVASATLTLPFELRCRSRLRARLDDGREAALFLPRGDVLRGGDRLLAEDGTVIEVRAAPELCSVARTGDALRLARACYHLGNRHVALQIGRDWVRYLHDHVLDEMVSALDLDVHEEWAPFEPEAGAYPSAAHGHGPAHADHPSHAHAH